MERDLESHRATLDLPYCFTDGAHALIDAWVKSCAELGHDVEVGVYFSSSHAIHAEWHRDENHNFTFQLLGQKDWLHLPAADVRAHGARPDGSRGMFDAPRNRAELHAVRAQAGPAGCGCVSMAPGSVLYLPPGHWHRVVPVAGPCVSVNLRVGQLLRARWLCEALFAALSAAPFDGHDAPTRALGRGAMQPAGSRDFGAAAPSAAMDLLIAGVRRTLPQLLASCPLPRALPCERALSNGLERAARLSFLAERGCLAPAAEVAPSARLRPSALFALVLKQRGADKLLVHMTAASALSGTEFLRFTVHCGARLEAGLSLLLVAAGGDSPTVAELCAACERAGGGGGGRAAGRPASCELVELLRALVYARALARCGEKAGVGGQQASAAEARPPRPEPSPPAVRTERQARAGKRAASELELSGAGAGRDAQPARRGAGAASRGEATAGGAGGRRPWTLTPGR